MRSEWTGKNLLFRQVHPHHWDGTRPNSVAFLPTPKDKDLLSVDDAALVTAEASWSHFTQNLGFRSVGTWAVSVEEICDAGGLEARADPLHDNSAHCVIDYSSVTTKGQKKKRAQILAMAASGRGCQFAAPAV
ncbi:MAG: hypothetical protein JJT96_15430 [Opitutales bacterium]|nr:hypothetical protein [Opitutales bacterium]